MTLDLAGLEENIEVPIKVQLQRGKTVEFDMEFKRMTREEIRDSKDRDYKRSKEALKLTEDMQQVLNIKSRIKVLTDDSVIEDYEKQLKDMLSIEEMEQRIKEISFEADEELKDRIIGWKRLKDNSGKTVKFNRDNLSTVLDSNPYFLAINEAQFKATGEYIKNL